MLKQLNLCAYDVPNVIIGIFLKNNYAVTNCFY